MAIIKCSCKHEGQDRLHGKSMRVHTPTSKQGSAKCRQGDGDWRCTVCLSTKPNSAG